MDFKDSPCAACPRQKAMAATILRVTGRHYDEAPDVTNPMPAPIFFGGSRQAIDLMHQADMAEMMIAMVLIDIRAAAITEERLRVERVALNHPPCAGIRPQDILAEISGHSTVREP